MFSEWMGDFFNLDDSPLKDKDNAYVNSWSCLFFSCQGQLHQQLEIDVLNDKVDSQLFLYPLSD